MHKKQRREKLGGAGGRGEYLPWERTIRLSVEMALFRENSILQPLQRRYSTLSQANVLIEHQRAKRLQRGASWRDTGVLEGENQSAATGRASPIKNELVPPVG